MKIANSLKKTAAAAVAAAVVTAALPLSGLSAAAENEFNPNNVVLRFGVMSDIHQSYDEYSVGTIKNVTLKYTNSVAELNALAGNQLDALLLCGDYTSTGQEVQAETFASSSKAAVDAINAGKAEGEKTKFIMAYGNHDTEWPGQMNYTEWEAVLDKYGLLKDNVEKGPELSGCYKTTIEKNGKTYHFISLETETYNNPSNTFRTDVLEWLDSELAAAVKENPNSYVYIISHGPIKETGVYGSDIEFEKDADWGTAEAGYTGTVERDGNTYATSSEIDAVLSKYPQVVYFSGHTHYTNELESSIMSNGKYTAVTVSALGAGERYSSLSKYLDGSNYNITPRPGYALYVEVDANGNQRIRRIEAPYDWAETELTDVTDVEGVQSNTEGQGLINGIVVNKVDIKSTKAELNDTVEPWVMSAPKTDKSHLVKYTAEARRRTPVFGDSAAVSISELYATADTLRADVQFSAAECDTNIIRYEIALIDPAGNVSGSHWALGNWTPNNNGVLTGTSHYDATEFKYTGVNFSCGKSLIGYSVRVTAVDEFGGRASIQSEKISAEPDRLIEDTDRPIRDNLFTVTPDRAVASEMQNNVEFTLDENGKLVTTVDSTEGYRNAVFMVSESKYNALVDEDTKLPFRNWAYPGTNPQNLTDLTADDTFVWEADFSSTEGDGYVYFHIRTPELNIGDDSDTTIAAWHTDYTGIMLNKNGVYLSMCDYQKLVSNEFKFDDTATHHIKAISSPKFISIWIDGVQLCDNMEFNPAAWADTSLAGRFNSDKMIPTMAIHVNNQNGGRKLTVSNQELYYYYITDEAKSYKAADELVESNMFDGITAERAFPLSQSGYVTNTITNGKLTTKVNLSEVVTDPHTNLCYVTSAKNFSKYGAGIYKSWASSGSKNARYFTDLSAEDTFIYEADFTIDAINAIYFHLRTPDLNFDNGLALWQTDYTGVRISGSGVRLYMAQKPLGAEYPIDLADSESHHIVIKSTPEAVTVTIDGAVIFENAAFNKAAGVAADIPEACFDSEAMYPTMAIFVMGVDMELSNQKLGKLADVTLYTDDSQNLLNSDAGSLYSGIPVIEVTHFEQNSFFSDMRYTNPDLDEKYYYWQNQAFPFGGGNQNYNFDKAASYLFSGLMTAENGTLGSYSSRMTVNFGRYDNKGAFAFVQNTTLYFYFGDTCLKTFDLATLYGYKIGDTVRVTALITPFGFEYYFDGNKVYGYSIDADTIDYSVLSFGISGAKGAWRDIVFYENTANGALYAEKLTAKAKKINETKGVYFTESAKATAAEIIAAASALEGKDNSTLKAYVSAAKELFNGSKVTNNMVAEGKTAVSSDFERTFTDDSTWWINHGIPLFADGECPINKEDKWSVDFDFTVNKIGVANPYEVRLAFAPYGNGDEFKDVKGGAMIQDASLHAINISSAEQGYKGIGVGTKSIRLVGGEFHVNFSVVPTEDGKHTITTVLTSVDGSETYMNLSFTAENITEIKPYIYYRAADITFSNLCVSYDLTDDFTALENVCESKDLSDIAVICARNYESAYKTGSAILSNRDYYTRDEIRNATAKLSSAAGNLQKYGDVNLDKATDIRDLVRLKKILCAVEDETVTADINGDGDVVSDDLAMLRKYLLTK